MLANLLEAFKYSKSYNIQPDDILFLDFCLSGVVFHSPYSRVRFEFIPEDKPYFKASIYFGVDRYFFALPVNRSSLYHIEEGRLIASNEIIGYIKGISEDTCDSSYTRRGGTVLNLNPIPKSQCHGCKFCHTIVQSARDKEENLGDEIGLRKFIESFMEKRRVADLSHLIQVAVVTGCFGSEQKVLEWLKMARKVLNDYGFRNELFYYGSEITSDRRLNELEGLEPFGYCLSWEVFGNREKILKYHKAKITLNDAKRILQTCKTKGFRSTFSYIIGLEPLELMLKGFKKLIPYITSFPIINVYQIHHGQENLRHPSAWNMNYYLKARKMLERIFKDTPLRPRPWENYRSLWYLTFGDEILYDIRVP